MFMWIRLYVYACMCVYAFAFMHGCILSLLLALIKFLSLKTIYSILRCSIIQKSEIVNNDNNNNNYINNSNNNNNNSNDNNNNINNNNNNNNNNNGIMCKNACRAVKFL